MGDLFAILNEYMRYIMRRKRKKSTARRYATVIKKRLTGKKLSRSDILLEPFATYHWNKFMEEMKKSKNLLTTEVNIHGDLVYLKDRDYFVLFDDSNNILKAIEDEVKRHKSTVYMKVRGTLIIEKVQDFFDLER